MSLNVFTWPKVIVAVQGNLCFASSMWNIICKYPVRRLLNKNWKEVEEIFQRIEYIKTSAEHLKPLFQCKMLQACRQGQANLCHGISK